MSGVSFNDSDWTRGLPAPPRLTAAPPVWWWSALLGAVIGALSATAMWWWLEGSRAHRQPPLPPDAMIERHPSAAGIPTAKPAMGAMPAEPAPKAATPNAAPPLAAETTGVVETFPTDGAASAPRTLNAPRDAEAERKAQAWARHYRRPAVCEGNPSQEQMVECANHYIRARRQFEARYSASAPM